MRLTAIKFHVINRDFSDDDIRFDGYWDGHNVIPHPGAQVRLRRVDDNDESHDAEEYRVIDLEYDYDWGPDGCSLWVCVKLMAIAIDDDTRESEAVEDGTR